MVITHFRDRQEAGKLLAVALKPNVSPNTILLALPRGGVEVGAVIANELHLPLSIVIARKIGHPDNPEYAIGAVTETGQPVLNRNETDSLNQDWLQSAIAEQRHEAERRRREYLGQTPLPELAGYAVVLIDDGMATGLTLRAAITEVQTLQTKNIIVALPVGPADTIRQLEKLVDRVITLNHGQGFLGAIGAHYSDFPQLTDDDVRRWLVKSEEKSLS